jgi:hypothetical protein
MILYAYCMFIELSLHRELLNLILVGEPLILRWFYHSIVVLVLCIVSTVFKL